MKPPVLIFQSSRDLSWRDKLDGAYVFAKGAGWQLHVIGADADASEIRQSIKRWKPAGCIVERGMSLGRNPVSLFAGIPTVYLDQNPDTATQDAAMVCNDSAAYARLAAKELLETGVRNFTYIPYGTSTSWCHARSKAFAAAIRRAGRRFIPWNGSLERLPKPCGILCAEDSVAQAAMEDASRLSIRIPEDLMFIGIDNDPMICDHTNPPLTSVQPDFRRAGYMAAEMLARRIANPKTRIRCAKYGPTAIIRRGSSIRTPTYDIRVSRALACIAAHVFEPKLSTEAIVKAMGCSRRLADLIFTKAVGHSIRHEIHRRRFEKACLLLRTSNMAIGDIPYLCGYDSTNFFQRMFKRESGMTMRTWRQRNRC